MGKKQKVDKRSQIIQQLEEEQYQEDDSEIQEEEQQNQEISQQEEGSDQEEIQNDDQYDEDDEEENFVDQDEIDDEQLQYEDDENINDDDEENGDENEDEELPEGQGEDEELVGECDDGQEGLLTDGQQIANSLLGKNKGADQALINMKIHEIVKILCNFKKERDETRSRQSYMDELNEYLCQYYSYNKELMELFQQMFNPNELLQFLEANEQQRILTIRTNTLKTRRKELAQVLIQRGVNLDPLAEWSKVGIKIYDSKVPVGATPEYLAGHYMLQSASSFLPVIALAPQVDERVLDMAAAPGGKTSYIAQLMKNTGQLFANDISADRLKGLFYNLQRMGINNTSVCNYDGRKFPKVMKNFDRVLLDAPCTGLGIISRDHSIKGNKNMMDVYKHAHLQRELICSAIDVCKKGGYVVYSTCSVAPQENEAVVNYALNNRHVKLVECGIEIGEEGLTKFLDKRYHPELKKTRRIYPHIHNLDGFYVAKLKKIDDGPKNPKKTQQDDITGKSLEELQSIRKPKTGRSKQMNKKDQKKWQAIKDQIAKLQAENEEKLSKKKAAPKKSRKQMQLAKFNKKQVEYQNKLKKQQQEQEKSEQKQEKQENKSQQQQQESKPARKNSKEQQENKKEAAPAAAKKQKPARNAGNDITFNNDAPAKKQEKTQEKQQQQKQEESKPEQQKKQQPKQQQQKQQQKKVVKKKQNLNDKPAKKAKH